MTLAVHPGINRICLKLRLKPDNLTDLASPKGAQGSPNQHSNNKPTNHPISPYATIAFDEADMPPKEVYEPLLEVFFDALAQHFPSIQRLRVQNRLANGTMSAFLLNGMWMRETCRWKSYAVPDISALCDSGEIREPGQGIPCECQFPLNVLEPNAERFLQAGDVFADKAMQLLVPAIRLPTTDAITSLLLLSQCEFGQNSESGYWVSHLPIFIFFSECRLTQT